MINQLEHILQAIKQLSISENTCAYEFQAHRDLIPECKQGLSCPYPNQTECDKYKKLGVTEQRFTHFRLYGR